MTKTTEEANLDAVAAQESSDTEAGGKKLLSLATVMELIGIPVIVVIGALMYVWWRNTATLDSVEKSALAWPEVWLGLKQHLMLTFISAALVVIIAVPLGVLLTRKPFRKVQPIAVAIANLGLAAPSVGLLVLAFMWFSTWTWLNVSGMWAAIITLGAYAILPVLANTIAGLNGVDQTLIEAGRGVGMSSLACLFKIELPLALPVIMAGIRTALVLLVGTATLATFINGGGLGGIIQAGIALFRYPVMVWGAVLVALLALLIEWLGRILELLVRPKGVS